MLKSQKQDQQRSKEHGQSQELVMLTLGSAILSMSIRMQKMDNSIVVSKIVMMGNRDVFTSRISMEKCKMGESN